MDYLGGGDLPPFKSASNLITALGRSAVLRVVKDPEVKRQTLADFPFPLKLSTSFGYQTNGGFLADKRGGSRIVDVFKAETKLTITERREDYDNYREIFPNKDSSILCTNRKISREEFADIV